MISVIAAPPGAPQVVTKLPPPPQPRLDRLDQRLIAVVRQEGVIPLWSLLNLIAAEETNDRAIAREVRLGLWQRVRRLVGRRLLRRHGRKCISTTEPPRLPTPSRQGYTNWCTRLRKGQATVRPSPGAQAVSTRAYIGGVTQSHNAEPVGTDVVRSDFPNLPTPATKQQIKTDVSPSETTVALRNPAFPTCCKTARNNYSVEPSASEIAGDSGSPITTQQLRPPVNAQQISDAARALARMPRNRKRWTGWLNDQERGYRDMPVLLPDGKPAYLFGALRGRAVVTPDRGQLLGGWGDGPLRWAVVPASTIHRRMNSAAQLLGSMKRGIRERSSERKAAAARLNGTRPCRPGKRRGRRPLEPSTRSA